MNSRIISAVDIPERDGECVFGIENKTYLQIYNFFVDHPQTNIYIIDDKSVTDKTGLLTHDLGMYNRFGIYFADETISTEKEYILFVEEQDLSSEDALSRKISEQLKELQCDGFSFAAIRKEYRLDEDRERDAALLAKALPNVTVMNKGLSVKQRYISTIERRKGYEYWDISDLFRKYCVTSSSSVRNMENIYKISDEIRKMAGPKCIFYLDQNKLASLGDVDFSAVNSIAVNLATYLALESGCNFDFDERMNREVLTSAERVYNRDFNYLDEYLKMLKNPLQFGITFRDGDGYICLKDKRAMKADPERYRTRLTMQQVMFDVQEKRITEAEVTAETYSLEAIELLSLADLFGVKSRNFADAHDAFLKLNEQLSLFEELLSKKYYVTGKDSLCMSNVLLFKCDGVYRLGYVPTIDCKVPYVIGAMDGRFSFFNREFSHEELCSILDINLAVDRDRWLEMFRSSGYLDNNVHVKLPSHAKGILLSNMKVNKEKLAEVDGVAFEEIGVWYQALTQYRGGRALVLYKYILPKSAREMGLITYFGGPFMYDHSDIQLGPQCWRC